MLQLFQGGCSQSPQIFQMGSELQKAYLTILKGAINHNSF